MKKYVTCGLLLLTTLFGSVMANTYIVIYATLNGRTGHAGIAIDNYQVQRLSNGKIDTVRDGTLTYYDLWPAEDDFSLARLTKDQPAQFYKLPSSIWPSAITPASLFDAGIPHREFYPCDGLLMLRSAAAADYRLKLYLNEVIRSGRPFNARFYNCCDFVADAVRELTGADINAKEVILFGNSSTPNKLCRQLMTQPGTVVLKAPGDRIKGSFLEHKLLAPKPGPSFLASH
ncbi:MAG: hypothetical protein P0Y53_21360 [Candidatus Pseudobacter hemicellulosilyticus]|uniref:Permuted papain-like amidase YaeF/Yiix C92 family enzyme n=1 Tax=Candidatus Pseudobacter hemicellulosilyticus TaxID=3121375 RepID=A0AAJ6BEX9_9BACT|nr:MAG: hypothetical protein P0Y53_21360 [Pseudobacter sp.]